jgi:hypothetical protein
MGQIFASIDVFCPVIRTFFYQAFATYAAGLVDFPIKSRRTFADSAAPDSNPFVF